MLYQHTIITRNVTIATFLYMYDISIPNVIYSETLYIKVITAFGDIHLHTTVIGICKF